MVIYNMYLTTVMSPHLCKLIACTFPPQLWRPVPCSALVGSVWLERTEKALVSVVLDSSLMNRLHPARVSCMYSECVMSLYVYV